MSILVVEVSYLNDNTMFDNTQTAWKMYIDLSGCDDSTAIIQN